LIRKDGYIIHATLGVHFMLLLVGSIFMVVALILFFSLFYNDDHMCKDEEQRYQQIVDKIKPDRSLDEQDLIDKTWHIYWQKKISKSCFVIGILFISFGILSNM
jgi:hypothetical protein